MRLSLVACLALAACGPTYVVPDATGPAPVALPADPTPVGPGGPRTAADFRRVAARVEPAAEAMCRQQAPQADCDYLIGLETDPSVPPNAFQTLQNGRPVIIVASSLLREMRSDDEIAFVLSHEASHHIAGHLGKQAQQQALGALLLGGLVAATGQATGTPASDQAIRQAMDVGGFVGARAYSQSYELEADTLGAYIAARAGYTPERGAEVFTRPALENPGGPAILATHPASAQRAASIARVAADIHAQQAAGLVPSPRTAR
jgi:Zn-dependent protease with chaperone function